MFNYSYFVVLLLVSTVYSMEHVISESDIKKLGVVGGTTQDGRMFLKKCYLHMSDQQMSDFVKKNPEKFNLDVWFFAFFFNDISIEKKDIKKFIQRGANLNFRHNKFYSRYKQETLFYHLCRNPSYVSKKLIKYCLQKGAQVTGKEYPSLTALHYILANENCTVPILEILLEHGGDLHWQSTEDDSNKTPFHFFCQKNTRLFFEVLEYLFEQKASLLIQDADGRTAFHHICLNPAVTLKVLQLFVERGADVNHKTKGGNTPLHFLCQNLSVTKEILEYMLKRGASLYAVTKLGNTPLHFLCENGSITPKLLMLLLEHKGSDLNQKNESGATPFYKLLQNKKASRFSTVTRDEKHSLAMLNLCLDHKADFNGLTPNRKSFLFTLCKYWCFSAKIIELILTQYTTVDIYDREQNTPLHVLLTRPSCEVTVEMITLLLKKGANSNGVDKKGKKPLYYACKKYNVDVANYLHSHASYIPTENEERVFKKYIEDKVEDWFLP